MNPLAELLATLLASRPQEQWQLLRQHLAFLKGADPSWDQAMELVDQFERETQGALPDRAALLATASREQNAAAAKYVQDLPEGPVLPDVPAFHTSLMRFKSNLYDMRIRSHAQSVSAALAQGGDRQRIDAVNTHLNSMASEGSLYLGEQERHSSLLYGAEAVKQFRKDYQQIQQRKSRDELLYLTLGFEHFEDVKYKPGDLVFFGGFTAQGKSVWLRWMSYHLAVHYGLNTFFFTLEVAEQVVRTLFYLIHANNSKIFPTAPRITYDDYREGNLTEEQIRHLEQVAIPDLTTNPNYGTLYVEQPAQSRFTVQDLAARIHTNERVYFAPHVVAVDYLTLMYPVLSDRAVPQRADYNQLVKDFKQLILTHRHPTGDPAPLLGISAAQVSRHRYDEALKANGHYNIQAFSDYSEIERSSDVVFTTLMSEDQRAINQMRLQCHKNREGRVPVEPCDFFVDLAHGQGVYELQQYTAAEIVEDLRSIDV